jgi:hypothetical protein
VGIGRLQHVGRPDRESLALRVPNWPFNILALFVITAKLVPSGSFWTVHFSFRYLVGTLQ